MTKVSVLNIKELREKTGAGMMECKKALLEAEGDMVKAAANLRKKGFDTVAKKAARVAAEGLVAAYTDPQKKIGALVEINCETDFAAKHKGFKKLALGTAKMIAERNPVDQTALFSLPLPDGETVGEAVVNLVAVTGENIVMRRFVRFETGGTGAVDYYIHDDFLSEGKIGVLVEFRAVRPETLTNPQFISFMKEISLQVVSGKPKFASRNEIPTEVLERKKADLINQAVNEGKTREIAEKIALGKLEKYVKETCLYEQPFIKDSEKIIAQLLQEINTTLMAEDISVVRFARFERGEGAGREKTDLAAEVAAELNRKR